MKLYDLDHSPFAARVRMAIYAKGLPIALVPPPGGVHSDAYRAINPLGLVPALVIDDGTVIAESEVIVEYLEDRFPVPPLRPHTAEHRALAWHWIGCLHIRGRRSPHDGRLRARPAALLRRARGTTVSQRGPVRAASAACGLLGANCARPDRGARLVRIGSGPTSPRHRARPRHPGGLGHRPSPHGRSFVVGSKPE